MLLKELREKLFHSSKIRKIKQNVDVACPFVSHMKLLKSSLQKKFNQYVPIKLLVTLTVIVFVVSTVLHLLLMFVFHKFQLSERLFTKAVKTGNCKISVKPHAHVNEEHLTAPTAFEQKFRHRFLFHQSLAIHVRKKPGTSMV